MKKVKVCIPENFGNEGRWIVGLAQFTNAYQGT